MKLTLFTRNSFNTILLPEKHAGQYWVTARDEEGRSYQIAAVEGVRATADQSGAWMLKSNSHYRIFDSRGEAVTKLPLENLTMYRIRSVDDQEDYRLYTEPLSQDRNRYSVYRLTTGLATLTIGRGTNCDIRYANGYVGKLHATLHMTPDRMQIVDNDSLNRTFVNGRSVRQAPLKNGDTIYMMGLQIIVTKDYLYINDPDGAVTIQTRMLERHHVQPYQAPDREDDLGADPHRGDDFYYRAPRFKQDVEPLIMKLDPPPNPQLQDETPVAMTLGPSITMGMASAATAGYSVINAIDSGNIKAAIPSMVMSLGMLCGTLLWPNVTRSYQKKNAKKKEAQRQESYTAYLQEQRQTVAQETARQEQILRANDLTPGEYLARASAQPPLLWERTPKHSDFLCLGLGRGRLGLNAQVQYPERRFSVTTDNLTEMMYAFGEEERWLEDVPICLDLKERGVTGVYARRERLLPFAQDLILKLTTTHSYDEVKLVVLYNPGDAREMSFVRWLPHTMDDQRKVRYLATTGEEARELSGDLENILAARRGLRPEQLQELPRYVVLCLDKQLCSRTDAIRSILESREDLGFSFIAMYQRLKDLPKECSAVVALEEGDEGSVTLLDDVSQAPIRFRTHIPENMDMEALAAILSNTTLETGEEGFQMPSKYTFLQMMDVGMVEHINLLENWSTNDPTKSLAAPIGIDRCGEKLMLDLHEKAHGPHGLMAGMTGSGKSETIMAYILSMAIRYHPQEVAFILIDYKGGGMAKAFENIPHTAGIITNLDGSAINRSLVSMKSELHRRERIFQQVGKQHGVSNVDIYKYQKLFRQGKVSEPLPHLVIISDEFAELKKDQPEFMTELTSTARVGRSLGVHLILATQKPGGVVDDQIRSNSRFRLCLKVQDRGDSMEMMERPEASTLTDTGRFYLQVGNNEVFELGQSAWAGAGYQPAPRPKKELDDAIRVIDTNGRTLVEVNTDRRGGKDERKQLDVITEYISRISDEENIRRWKMWLEPIPGKIYVDDLAEKYAVQRKKYLLEPVVGEYDDPAHQSQGILRVPLTAEGNVIVYGSAGSGKELFLESMCYDMMKHHTPGEVNFYILDFGSEAMTALAGAPHVGDVILAGNTEKVENLFKLLHGKLSTRKKLLSSFGGSLEQYNAQAEEPLPNIVVMIHNFAHFSELYEARLGDISYLTREGTRYGIYFVLTCAGVNNVRFSLLQNFKSLYCLQLNNPDDYSTVVGKTGGLLPAKHPGRGMVRMDKGSVLEFQTARVTQEDPPQAWLRGFCQDLSKQYPGKKAQPVPVLPETVSADFLMPYARVGLTALPVGVEKDTLDIARVDMTAQCVLPVLAMNQEWKPFTDSLAQVAASGAGVKTYLLAPGGSKVPKSGNLTVCDDRAECLRAVQEIFRLVLERNNSYKDALADGTPLPEFTPVLVVIQSMQQLKSLLSGVAVGKEAVDDTPMNRIQLAMEKCDRAYRVSFLVAEDLQQLTPFTAERWYKAQITGNSGIWLGSGAGSQFRLTISRKPAGFSDSLPGDFGLVIRNSAATLVKFLQ